MVVSRHDRKGGGEVGESARGSTAWTGAVDTVMSLAREAGRPSVRKLATISRFDEAPDELILELVEGEYVVRGTEAAYATAEAKAAIPALLDEPMQRSAIATALTIPEATVRRALADLMADGAVTRLGAGKKGDAWTYVRAMPEALDSFPATLRKVADRK